MKYEKEGIRKRKTNRNFIDVNFNKLRPSGFASRIIDKWWNCFAGRTPSVKKHYNNPALADLFKHLIELILKIREKNYNSTQANNKFIFYLGLYFLNHFCNFCFTFFQMKTNFFVTQSQQANNVCLLYSRKWIRKKIKQQKVWVRKFFKDLKIKNLNIMWNFRQRRFSMRKVINSIN